MTWLLRRLLMAPVVLLVLVAATFLLVEAVPGDPFAGERAMDPQVRAQLMQRYALDRPLPERFVRYVGGLLVGDFGPSLAQQGRSVGAIIGDHLPVSALLGALALAVALAAGVLLGVIGALGRHGPWDGATLVVAVTMLSIPTFVIGPLLVLVVAQQWGWLPVAGWDLARPATLILPALTLAVPFIGRFARLTRTGLQEVLDADAVRTARAKGASEWRALVRHALPLGLVPVTGFLGPAIAGLLTGSLVVEMVFAIPGLGREFVHSALNRDLPLVLGTVVVYGLIVVLCNLASDLLLAWLDPRVRARQREDG